MEKIKLTNGKEYVVEKIIYENKNANTCVMAARDEQLQRTVVLKKIEFNDKMQKASILKEIQNQIIIEGYSDFTPKIHNVFVNEKEHLIWIEMQKIIGKSLRSFIDEEKEKRHDKQWYEEMFYVFCLICRSVSELHHAEMFIHKDLKPENIIINRKRRVAYIIDFGISGPGMNKGIGTERYMAPEQRPRVDKYFVSQATDVFALGMIGVEMFTGETLCYGKDLVFNPTGDTWKKQKDISEIGQDFYPELGRVLSKALSMDPKERFMNAEQMLNALQKRKYRGSENGTWKSK